MPATAGDFFGVRHAGAIYGVMVIAWSIGGVVSPGCPWVGRSNDHLGASAAVVDAVNGVLARAHRRQRGVPECGAVHTVLPHAIRSGGSAVPCLRCSAR